MAAVEYDEIPACPPPRALYASADAVDTTGTIDYRDGAEGAGLAGITPNRGGGSIPNSSAGAPTYATPEEFAHPADIGATYAEAPAPESTSDYETPYSALCGDFTHYAALDDAGRFTSGPSGDYDHPTVTHGGAPAGPLQSRDQREVPQHPEGYAVFRPGARAVAATPTATPTVATLIDQGIKLRKRGKVGEAVQSLRHAIELEPKSVAAWTNLGNLLCDSTQTIPEAVEAYQTALAIDPTRATVWFNLGHLHEKQEHNLAAALAAYRRAIEVDPTHSQSWCNSGLVYLEQGDSAAAEKAFRGAVKCDPLHATAWYKLGGILNKRRKFKEGKRAWKKCLEIDPNFCRADKIKALLDL
jgi:Tfp pilus assembly protein PilF